MAECWAEGEVWDLDAPIPDVAPFKAFRVMVLIQTAIPTWSLEEWQRKMLIGLFPNDEAPPPLPKE